MYEAHFGLQESPFSLTPDTSYFYAYPDHQEALNVLLVALRMGEGFIKVVGEVGTGKTLVCRKLLNTLGDEGMVTAYIPNPLLTPTALYYSVAQELGLTFPKNIGQHRVLGLINDELIRLRVLGKKVALLLDEAQALPAESLEAIRLLTNLETEKHKLLQVVLFGQPELDSHLNRSSARQLKQRITFSENLNPLSAKGVAGYVEHRLGVAGYQGESLFSIKAIEFLCRGSRGSTEVNVLAHKALLACYSEGSATVKRSHVQRAIDDTDDAQIQKVGWFYLLRMLFNPALRPQVRRSP